MHECEEPSQHLVDFFFEIFLWKLVSVLFQSNFVNNNYSLLCKLPMHLRLMHHIHMCALMNGSNSPYTLLPQYYPQKAQAVSPSYMYAQSKAQMNHP